MRTTKVFKSGNSKAVRIPQEFNLKGNEVEIFKRNHDIVIREIPKNLSEAFKLMSQLPDDFFANGRKDDLPQERDF